MYYEYFEWLVFQRHFLKHQEVFNNAFLRQRRLVAAGSCAYLKVVRTQGKGPLELTVTVS